MSQKPSYLDQEEFTDFFHLADELAETKRQMAKYHQINQIPEPDHGELFALRYLSDKETPVCPKDLSEAMHISSARIARLLNQLEKKNFIKRSVDPNNKRQTVILLLPAGREQQKKNVTEFRQRAITFLKALGADDAKEYIRLQKKILELYKK